MTLAQRFSIKNILLSVAACAAVTLSGTSFSAETPPSLQDVTVVDATKAKALADSGAKLIDTRVANEYVEAHPKGAINVPYKEKSTKSVDFNASQDSFDMSKLPSDKNTAVVFHCNGPECWKSYKASVAALKAGYKKIYWFRSGFPEWKSKGFPIE